MARLNLVRSLCAVSLLAFSVTAWIPAASAADADADAEPQPVVVKVHADHFEGQAGDGRVYARSGQKIVFQLVDPADTRHTVTIEGDDCHTRYTWLCEQRFDNPRDKTVDFRFSVDGEYGFYDRYAKDAGREMTGRFIISAAPPPIPPATTTTTSTTTTSTAPPSTTPSTAPTTTTSTAPTTTTTAPSSIRPFLIPDPAPATTTTTAQPAPPPPNAAPAGDKDKDKKRDNGKSKAAGTETPTTATPADPHAVPPDSLFDPAMLTPGPTALSDIFGFDSGDQAALDAAALADLLDPASVETDSGDGRLTVYVVGAFALVLMVGGAWAWQHRSSRYFPA